MNDEELDRALAGLPPRDVDPLQRERVRRRAHEALAQRRTRWPSRLWPSRLWHGVFEPLLVASVCAAHLAWALSAAVGLLAP